MAFVIYHKETTKQHRVRTQHVGCYKDIWATKRAAKAACTRGKLDTSIWLIAEIMDFRDNIELTEIIYSIFDTEKKKPITVSVNTPFTSTVASETYWAS